MSLNLLEKTELWINGITLKNANLSHMADKVAEVLGVPKGKVLVVDVRPGTMTFDVLWNEVPQENLMGKERVLLDALAEIPGVQLHDDANICSDGILGLICTPVEQASGIISKVSEITNNVIEKLAMRAMIFPTGFELEQGLIEDTNTPYLEKFFQNAGYTVKTGKPISDSKEAVYFALTDALSQGFGLIVTTGGVGAEDKDHTVEGILKIDPDAATPYIVKFQKGSGRHVKDGVRIAVGQEGKTLIVALPGPHDEVQVAAQAILSGLKEGLSKEALAVGIARVLTEKLQNKKWHHNL